MNESAASTVLYGRPNDKRCAQDRQHCAHATGRSHTDGMGEAGGMEVECCFCGARCEVPYRYRDQLVRGHGPHHTVRQCVIEWPRMWKQGWKDEP